MQKFVSLLFIGVFFVVSLTGCGGGSTSATQNPQPPTSFATYTGASLHAMGGTMQQGTALAFSGIAARYAGVEGASGFTNYTGHSTVMATFNQPNDITTPDGKVFYVADYGNSAIRKIYTDPVSQEVFTTTLQFVDAAAPTTAISFYHPTGITTDGTGAYLYVVDYGYNCIRVIDLLHPTATNQYLVYTIGSTSGQSGSVDSIDKTEVRFNQPIGITTDGVNVYVTDYGNATIRWFNTSTVDPAKGNYAVYTLAGNAGSAGNAEGTRSDARFNLPTRITTDGNRLYVTDSYNRTIRQIDIRTGAVTTLTGIPGQLGTDDGTLDGDKTVARFHLPNGITTDGKNLYVTDSYLGIIRVIDKVSGYVTTLRSATTSIAVSILSPVGLTTDGFSLFVADTYNVTRDNVTYQDIYKYSNCIRKIQ